MLEAKPATLWFVVRTKARQEKALEQTLRAAGLDCYLPLVRHTKFYGHRKRVSRIPLFSSYLFLQGQIDDTYTATSTGRVASIIPVADQVRLAHELAQIRAAIAADPDLVPHKILQRGIPARVTSGPFQGVEGLVESDVREGRLILQIHALGRAVSLEIDADLLEPMADL